MTTSLLPPTPTSRNLSSSDDQIPLSILDTDLYKLSMQCAVYALFPASTPVTYKFTNRDPSMLFSRVTASWTWKKVKGLGELKLQKEERKWLEGVCPYFSREYLDFLQEMRLKPESQVKVRFLPVSGSDDGENAELVGQEGDQIAKEGNDDDLGMVEMLIEGDWRECILYEVPLMAILSEAYFRFTDTLWSSPTPGDPHFSPTSAQEIQTLAKHKSLTLLKSSNGRLAFSEFGTRRRRSLRVMENVIEGLIEGDAEYRASRASAGAGAVTGGLVGTSNVHLAMKYGLKPVGTIAHEWIMAFGTLTEYENPNGAAMDAWEKVYPPSPTSPLHTMLTDTYTTSIFFQEFISDPSRALRWNGLRHDSGDPIVFAKAVKEAWEVIADKAIDAAKVMGTTERQRMKNELLNNKKVIFSDGLNVETALDIWMKCEEIGVKASFGIGTHFTNDFQAISSSSSSLTHPKPKTSKPLNIVIKLKTINGLECVKLTDDRGKYTGEKEEVEKAIRKLGLNGP